MRDKDGSLGAGPNTYVLINDGVNDSIATDAEACEIKPTWNAAVCKGDVGRLAFAAPLRLGGAGAGAGGPGGAAGPGAPGAPRASGPGGAPAAPAAGAGAGAAAAPAAGGPPRPAGGFGAAPAQPPVVLSRNGRDYTIVNGSNVRAGTEIKLATERPTLTLRLTELDKGSWVIFQLPGFNTADSGTQQTSLKALRKASETSYFKDKNALWVKVVSPDDGELGLGGGATVQVSR
jgi:hypothetical protein